MKQFFRKLYSSCITFLSMQIFLSLASLPILASWGLPISLMSPIGNVIFSPLLTLFLLISSIIFFCELLCIPNGIFIDTLEIVSRLWQWGLSCTYGSVLIACKKPALWICVCVTLIVFLSIRHRSLHNPLKRLIMLTILFIGCWLFFNGRNEPKAYVRHIPCNGQTVTYIYHNNCSILVDPGVLGKRISAPSWVAYTLIPEIIKATGCARIDHVIITKPGIVLYDALAMLCTKIPVKQITMPWLEGTMDEPLKRSFNRLYAQLKNQNISIKSFNRYPIKISLSDTENIRITPLATHATYRTIQYPGSVVTSIIDNQPVTLYDSEQCVNRSHSIDSPCQ